MIKGRVPYKSGTKIDHSDHIYLVAFQHHGTSDRDRAYSTANISYII